MGKLAELYKKKSAKLGEVINTNQFDKATQQKEFVEAQMHNRKISRLNRFAGRILQNEKIGQKQLISALGEEKYNEQKKEVDGTSTYTSNIYLYIKAERPELFNELDDKLKATVNSDQEVPDEVVDYLVKENKLSQKELDDVMAGTIVDRIGKHGTTEEIADMLDKVEGQLTPEQSERIAKEFETYEDILDQPVDAQIVHPYKEKCDALKKDASEAVKDPEKLKAYEEALDYAAEHLVLPSEDYHDEMFSRESTDYAPLLTPITEKAYEENKDTFRDGKYKNFYSEKKLPIGGNYHICEDPVIYESFRKEKVEFSEKTKEGMRKILAKMEEMKLTEYEYNPSGEDKDKVYSFNKLVAEQRALKDAIESKNPDKIIEASANFKKTWEDYEELYKIAKETLSDNPYLYPGNMDSIRSDYIPITFTQDLATAAKLNALFITYHTLKSQKAKMDSYIENPAGKAVQSAIDKMGKGSFEELSKNIKDYDEMLDLVFDMGKYRKVSDLYLSNVGAYGLARNMGAPNLLEGDPKKQGENFVYSETMEQIIGYVVENEQSKFDFLKHSPQNAEEREIKKDFYQKLIAANDVNRNLNAMLGDFPETDMLGGKLGDAMKLDTILEDQNHLNNNLGEMMDRAQAMIKKAGESRYHRGEVELITEAAYELYAKALSKHAFYRSNTSARKYPDYVRMLEEFEKGSSALPANASPELRARIDEIVEQRDWERSQEDPLNVMEEIEGGIERATKNVYNGSREYNEAAKAIQAYREAYITFLGMDKGANNQDQMAAIDKLIEKKAEAEAAIDRYFERKTRQHEMGPDKKKQNELDPKSQKRIHMMQRAKSALKGYEQLLSDRRIELEERERDVQKEKSYRADNQRINDNYAAYEKEFKEANTDMDRYAAKGAMDAQKALATMAKGKLDEPLSPKDMDGALMGMAAMMLHEKMQTPAGDILRDKVPKNMYTYKNELEKIVKSEAFQNVAPKSMVKSELREFLTERKHVRDFLEKFNNELIRIETRDLKAQQKKELNALQNKAVNSGTQRGRANAVTGKNPEVQTRPRSNTVNGKPQPKAQGDQPEGPNAGRAMNGPKGF